MFVDLSGITAGETVAVAVSGGQDSMALLHYLYKNASALPFKLACINVEHGIRGESSRSDSAFVKSYCEKIGVPLLSYVVDAKKKAETDKISIETSARILRYECFYDAIETKKCDKIATAHHRKDNYETILLNLFRGTGIKGLIGIKPDDEHKIIRPFLSVTKAEIEDYIKENGVPFVTDETNLSADYTRNALRLNVLPKIEELFPDAENAVTRLAETVKKDEEYLSAQAEKLLSLVS